VAREIFRGRIPDDRLYSLEYDMWVRHERGDVVIGATSFGIHLAGKIIGFTSKPRGAEIDCGRGLGTIECAKTVLAVHSPVSFKLLTMNEELEEHPSILNQDAYDAGWMSRGQPTAWDEESALLVDATIYRAHVMHIEPRAELE
jgi:glycine cleavage system H protein